MRVLRLDFMNISFQIRGFNESAVLHDPFCLNTIHVQARLVASDNSFVAFLFEVRLHSCLVLLCWEKMLQTLDILFPRFGKDIFGCYFGRFLLTHGIYRVFFRWLELCSLPKWLWVCLKITPWLYSKKMTAWSYEDYLCKIIICLFSFL